MKKRTTRFYFNRFGIKAAIWKNEYRPVHRERVTREQIIRANEMIVDMPARVVPMCK